MIGASKPMIESIRTKPGKVWDAIKNEFSGRVDAAEMPRQINRFGKTIGPLANTVTQDKQPFTFSKYQGPGQGEEAEDYYTRPKSKMGILAALRNRFYKPATMHTRDYTPAQLNRMNALGGAYSEPARRQRQDRTRVANLLARKAADKPYSQKNLNILTMGSRPGHYDRPGGGNGVQGTSTPSRSGGWHPGV